MAQELLYAASHVTGSFTNPNNALGDTPGTWAGDLNANNSYTSEWLIAGPTDPLTSGATQTFRVLARKGTNNNNPTIALELLQGGSVIASIGAVTITSTSGQILTVTVNTSAISNRNDIRVRAIQASAGGGPNDRNCAQVAYLEWDAVTTPSGPPTEAPVLSLVSKTHNSADLSWTTVGAITTYELQRDTVTIQNTSSTTRSDTGLDPVTTYSYRVRGVNASGGGPWSNVLPVETDEEPPPPPPAVRANSFEGGVPTEQITVGNSGGDSGDAFDSVWGTVLYSDQAVHGGVSAEHSDFGSIGWDFSLDNESIMWARAYMYHEVSGSGDISFEKFFTFFDDNLGGHEFHFEWLTTNGTGVVIALPSFAALAPVVPPFQWFRVEAMVDMPAEIYEVRLFLDPESETPTDSITDSFFANGTRITEIWFAELNSMVGMLWSDDVAVSNQGWIGPAITGPPVVELVPTDPAVVLVPEAPTLVPGASAMQPVEAGAQIEMETPALVPASASIQPSEPVVQALAETPSLEIGVATLQPTEPAVVMAADGPGLVPEGATLVPTEPAMQMQAEQPGMVPAGATLGPVAPGMQLETEAPGLQVGAVWLRPDEAVVQLSQSSPGLVPGSAAIAPQEVVVAFEPETPGLAAGLAVLQPQEIDVGLLAETPGLMAGNLTLVPSEFVMSMVAETAALVPGDAAVQPQEIAIAVAAEAVTLLPSSVTISPTEPVFQALMEAAALVSGEAVIAPVEIVVQLEPETPVATPGQAVLIPVDPSVGIQVEAPSFAPEGTAIVPSEVAFALIMSQIIVREATELRDITIALGQSIFRARLQVGIASEQPFLVGEGTLRYGIQESQVRLVVSEGVVRWEIGESVINRKEQ